MSEAAENKAVVQLPLWNCHKQVFADKILEVWDAPEHTGLQWLLQCGAVISVERDIIARGAPSVGDYYVQYADGYKSWSPAKPFEEGYTKAPANFVERMQQEENELRQKMEKLDAFFITDTYAKLDQRQKILLREQYHAMGNYFRLLCERLQLHGG